MAAVLPRCLLSVVATAPVALRTFAAAPLSSSNSLQVGATSEMSITASGVTRTSTAPRPATQARVMSIAWVASWGKTLSMCRWLIMDNVCGDEL